MTRRTGSRTRRGGETAGRRPRGGRRRPPIRSLPFAALAGVEALGHPPLDQSHEPAAAHRHAERWGEMGRDGEICNRLLLTGTPSHLPRSSSLRHTSPTHVRETTPSSPRRPLFPALPSPSPLSHPLLYPHGSVDPLVSSRLPSPLPLPPLPPPALSLEAAPAHRLTGPASVARRHAHPKQPARAVGATVGLCSPTRLPAPAPSLSGSPRRTGAAQLPLPRHLQHVGAL